MNRGSVTNKSAKQSDAKKVGDFILEYSQQALGDGFGCISIQLLLLCADLEGLRVGLADLVRSVIALEADGAIRVDRTYERIEYWLVHRITEAMAAKYERDKRHAETMRELFVYSGKRLRALKKSSEAA